jgi:hypothetical protein
MTGIAEDLGVLQCLQQHGIIILPFCCVLGCLCCMSKMYAGDVGFFVTAGQLLSYLVWKVLAQSALWGMTVLQV